MKKHFDNLGLPTSANRSDVKRAYRKLAMQLHPDKNSDPRAPGLFAELQESYDYLMDYLDPNQPMVKKKPSELRKEKTKEERIKNAKQRYYEQQLKEKRANERYFNTLTKGRKWKIYRVGSIICAVISLLLIVDSVLPNFKEKDEFIGWSVKESGGLTIDFVHPVYLKNSGKLYIEKGLYNDIHMHTTTYIQRTQIFHIPTKIIHPVDDELKVYHLDLCFSSVMYLAILFFLIPPLLLFYRKQTPNFSFTYLFSSYVIFPITIWFLISDNRWVHLLTLGIL